MKNIFRATVALVLVLCLLMVGCTQTQIITAVEGAVSAASIAFPVVAGAANLAPAVVSLIMEGLQAANQALAAISTALAAGGSTASIAATITNDLAGVVAQLKGLPPLVGEVATDVQTVVTDLEGILTQYGSPTPTSSMARSTPVGGMPGWKGTTVQWEAKDVMRLVAVRAKAQANMIAIQQWRLQHGRASIEHPQAVPLQGGFWLFGSLKEEYCRPSMGNIALSICAQPDLVVTRR
jgi:hypothetical protein